MSNCDTTFHYAEEYVQRGYAVIPLVGKIPPAGFRWSRYQHRRTTLAEINSWFGARCPCRYNIGIVTGRISGLAVVDIDRVGDVDWWTEKFPATPLAAVTGRGGVHLYYRANPLAQVRNRAGVHGRKIDIRGEGGYVVAPPSIHVDTGKVDAGLAKTSSLRRGHCGSGQTPFWSITAAISCGPSNTAATIRLTGSPGCMSDWRAFRSPMKFGEVPAWRNAKII